MIEFQQRLRMGATSFRWHAACGVFALLAALSGCKPSPAPIVDVPSDQPPIVDRLDREVPITAAATRIVSLSPSTTELLFALDLGPNIIGATKHCNYPEAALDIPRVGGGTLESISLEAIVAAKPDLVLAKWDTHQPLVDSLDRMGMRTLGIGPESLEQLFEEAQWIGKLTDRNDEAAALVSRMRARRERLTSLVARVQPTPKLKVFYEVWDNPLMTAGPDSFIDQLLQLAGLDNIIRDTAIAYPRINAETVLKGNPDLILAPTTHFEEVEVESIGQRTGWQGITAVQQHRIHLISGDEISRCGPRMLDALGEIILAAYPEVSASEVAASNDSDKEPTEISSAAAAQPADPGDAP